MVHRVSIILVTFNSHKTIRALLKSIICLNYTDIEFIIVDNGSNDGTISIIKEMMPQLEKKLLLKFFEANENIGFCSAANLAIQKASGKFLCIIDHDIEMTPFVLDELVGYLLTDNTVGAVQPKVVNAYDKRFIDSNDINENGSIQGFDASVYSTNRDILYPVGACSVIRASLFQDVGGFYDDFFVGTYDIDLGWRLWLLGYKVEAIYGVEIYHSRGTLRKKQEINLKLECLAFKNHIVMTIQNFEEKNVVRYLSRLLVIPSSNLLSNPPLAYKQFKSFCWVAKNLRLVLKRRYEIQSTRRIPDDELLSMLNYIFPKPLNHSVAHVLNRLSHGNMS
jgi:GT2 family glycosyltransferase